MVRDGGCDCEREIVCVIVHVWAVAANCGLPRRVPKHARAFQWQQQLPVVMVMVQQCSSSWLLMFAVVADAAACLLSLMYNDPCGNTMYVACAPRVCFCCDLLTRTVLD